MIAQAILYGIALAGNCAIVSGTLFSPMKLDPGSMRLYKAGPRNNEFEYAILKRGSQNPQESPDSKERRSQMGSSFIRFGRSQFVEGNPENAEYAAANEILDSGASSRTARGRSDVIIRFGRAQLKNLFGGGPHPADLSRYDEDAKRAQLRGTDFQQMMVLCSNVLASGDANGAELRLYLAKLVRLCNSLGLGAEDSSQARRESNVVEILEDGTQAEAANHQ